MSNSIINPGLRADIMRKRMEDRDTLKHRGSLYVGTGEKETINFNNEEVDIWKTKELVLPLDEYQIIISHRALTINKDTGAQFVTMSGVQVVEPYSIPVQKLVDTLNASYVLTKWGVTAENLEDPVWSYETKANGINFSLDWTEGRGFGLKRNSDDIGGTSSYAETTVFAEKPDLSRVEIAPYINGTTYDLWTVDVRQYTANPIVVWDNKSSTGEKQIANISLPNILNVIKISLRVRINKTTASSSTNDVWIDITPGYDGWCGNNNFYCTMNNVYGFTGFLGFRAVRYYPQSPHLSLQCTQAYKTMSYGYSVGNFEVLNKVELLGAVITYIKEDAF